LDAELRDLEQRVTAHLAAIPASWDVDADGVTGPQAGQAGDAAALPAQAGWMRSPAWAGAAAALIAEIGLDITRNHIAMTAGSGRRLPRDHPVIAETAVT